MSETNNKVKPKPAEQVARYLSLHPEFFAQNPELLLDLKVASPKGELTNLTTHQIKTLQQQNQQLKTQMAQLVQNAQQSEQLMNRLLNMLTDLSSATPDGWLTAFMAAVSEYFPSEYFQILLNQKLVDQLPDQVGEITQPVRQQFPGFQSASDPVSGRLKQSQLEVVFSDPADIKSAIVLPLGPQAKFGLMAFASKDEDKFHPHMASDILQKLAAVLVRHCESGLVKDESRVLP